MTLLPQAMGSRAADALPPEVYFFVEVPDLPAARAAGAKTAYGDIMAEPAVTKFIDSGFPALSDLSKDFRSVAGVGFREMLDFCKGEAAVAAMPDGAGGVAVVAVMDVSKDSKAFQDYLGNVEGRTGLAWEKEQIPGAEVRSAKFKDTIIAYTVAEQYFIVSNKVEQLKATTSGLLSGRRGSLSEDPLYVKCKSLGAIEKPEVTAYVNVGLITAAVMPLMPAGLAEAVRDAGIESLSAAHYGTRAAEKGFVDETVLYFADGRKGLFAAVTPASGDAGKYLTMIPSNSIDAWWASADAKALVDAITAIWGAAPAAKKQEVDDFLAEFEAASGVNLRADVVASLGGNIVGYTPAPTSLMGLGLAGGLGQQVTLVELSDPARFEGAVKAIWKYAQERQAKVSGGAPGQAGSGGAAGSTQPGGAGGPAAAAGNPQVVFGSEAFGDKTICRMQIVLSPALQVVPALAVRDKWLVMAGDAQAVKNALGAPLEFAPDITENSDYANGARIAGAGNAGISYTNTRAQFDTVYPMLVFGMPLVLAQLGGNTPVDQFLLPPANAISQHLFGSASSVSVDAQSIRITAFGPIGVMRGGYVAGVGAAALAKWFVATQSERTAPKPSGPAGPGRGAGEDDLRTLGATLASYAAGHQGAYPANAEELQKAVLAAGGGTAALNIERFGYVGGLTAKDDRMLVLAFDSSSGPMGRRVLLVGSEIMHLTDDEVAEQVGGWLKLPAGPTDEQKDAACLGNLRTLAASVKRYADSHAGAVPEEMSLKTNYRFAPLVTRCPADGAAPAERAAGSSTGLAAGSSTGLAAGGDYATIKGLNVAGVQSEFEAEVVLVYETGGRHGRMPGAAFLDGTVRRMTPEEMALAIGKSKIVCGKDSAGN
jgi:hypothetical protein